MRSSCTLVQILPQGQVTRRLGICEEAAIFGRQDDAQGLIQHLLERPASQSITLSRNIVIDEE